MLQIKTKNNLLFIINNFENFIINLENKIIINYFIEINNKIDKYIYFF